MGYRVATAYHPLNESSEEIYDGFCWPCLFFGSLWYAYKGMWGWAVGSLCLAVLTLGISWLILPFLANGQHANTLLKRGYLTQAQLDAKQRQPPTATTGVPSIADELSKLVALKRDGVLTEEEFQKQKERLIT